MSLAIDPWADEPLEPAETAERLKPEDMCEDINARLMGSQWDDTTLYPQLLAKTLHELSHRAAMHGDLWARGLLEQLHHRAVSGGWPGEQEAEPSWSLDTSTRESLIDQNLWPHPAPEHEERS